MSLHPLDALAGVLTPPGRRSSGMGVTPLPSLVGGIILTRIVVSEEAFTAVLTRLEGIAKAPMTGPERELRAKFLPESGLSPSGGARHRSRRSAVEQDEGVGVRGGRRYLALGGGIEEREAVREEPPRLDDATGLAGKR